MNSRYRTTFYSECFVAPVCDLDTSYILNYATETEPQAFDFNTCTFPSDNDEDNLCGAGGFFINMYQDDNLMTNT